MADASPLGDRRAGLLLHPTSLPGPYAQGDIGVEARNFVDFLAAAGFRVWQMLPVGPADGAGSPYSAFSTHAGNPELIDIGGLVEMGWLLPAEAEAPGGDAAFRRRCLQLAGGRFFDAGAEREGLAAFRERHARWLEDFALFSALKQHFSGRPWFEWPEPLRLRDPDALAAARDTHAAAIDQVVFEQYVFECQWQALRGHARERGVALFGDLPIFVARDSAEVWSEPGYFKLDAHGQCRVVAGVPPDYFSATGQRWGNPVYRWDRLEADDFGWWKARMATQLARFDLVRIDHFRGLESAWEIPAESEDATRGRWVEAPGRALLEALHAHFDALPLVAEDLGVITPAVDALREAFDLPGMRILQFAFDSDARNPYLPHNHAANTVVYTGTHDNDTTRSWAEGLDAATAARVADYLGEPGEAMPWPLVRAALASVARLAVVPMQDVLALGGEARMNTPGTEAGNWRWRFQWSQVGDGLAGYLARLNALYGRG